MGKRDYKLSVLAVKCRCCLSESGSGRGEDYLILSGLAIGYFTYKLLALPM